MGGIDVPVAQAHRGLFGNESLSPGVLDGLVDELPSEPLLDAPEDGELSRHDGDARGALSHETALDLYELCDVNPAAIHLTVLKGFRTRKQVPSAYRLHYANLTPGDVRWHACQFVSRHHTITPPTTGISICRPAASSASTAGLRIPQLIGVAFVIARAVLGGCPAHACDDR
jgi:hypothetical protein